MKKGRLENDAAQMSNKYLEPFLQSRNDLQQSDAGLKGVELEFAPDMTKEKLRGLKITNDFLPETLGASNQYKTNMASYLSSPGMALLKNLTPEAKSLVIQQLMKNGQLGTFLGQSGQNVSGGKGNATPSVVTGGMPTEAPPAKGQLPMPKGTGLPDQTIGNADVPGVAAALGNPQGNVNATVPDTKENMDILLAANQKRTSSANTQKRAQFAINIDKTLSTIDPSVITAYSGIDGALRLKRDEGLAKVGKTSPQYKEYVKFNTITVPALVQQVRQFYGTSIQPEMTKELEDLVNPITWSKNPELAAAQFNAFTNLMQRETKTYLDTLNAPIEDPDIKIPVASANMSVSPDLQKSPMVNVVAPDGSRGQIPADKLEMALQKGFKEG